MIIKSGVMIYIEKNDFDEAKVLEEQHSGRRTYYLLSPCEPFHSEVVDFKLHSYIRRIVSHLFRYLIKIIN